MHLARCLGICLTNLGTRQDGQKITVFKLCLVVWILSWFWLQTIWWSPVKLVGNRIAQWRHFCFGSKHFMWAHRTGCSFRESKSLKDWRQNGQSALPFTLAGGWSNFCFFTRLAWWDSCPGEVVAICWSRFFNWTEGVVPALECWVSLGFRVFFGVTVTAFSSVVCCCWPDGVGGCFLLAPRFLVCSCSFTLAELPTLTLKRIVATNLFMDLSRPASLESWVAIFKCSRQFARWMWRSLCKTRIKQTGHWQWFGLSAVGRFDLHLVS